MNKKLLAAGLAAVMTVGAAFSAYADYITVNEDTLRQSAWGSVGAGPGNGQFADNIAGMWISDGSGRKFLRETGQYCKSGWFWLDPDQDGTAECYRFDDNGYVYTSTTTPDGFEVNANGAWTLGGTVQTKHVSYDNSTVPSTVNRVAVTEFYDHNSAGPGAQKDGLGDTDGEGWKTSSNHYMYKQSDGSYARGGWYWLDSNRDGISECYYFDNDGYLYVNTTTPDGYTVGTSGAWIKDGKVQQHVDGYDGLNGSWKVDSRGWRFVYIDGTYPKAGFQWIDGNHDGISECYYFMSDGYIVTNNYVGDYYFDNDGRLIEDGKIVTRSSGIDNSWIFGRWTLKEVRSAILANPARVGSDGSITDMQQVLGIPESFSALTQIRIRLNDEGNYFVVPDGGKWIWFEKINDNALRRSGKAVVRSGDRIFITGTDFPAAGNSGRYYVGIYERTNG